LVVDLVSKADAVIPQTLIAINPVAFHPAAASTMVSATLLNSEKVLEAKVPEELLIPT
jgi:hypothetical protein